MYRHARLQLSNARLLNPGSFAQTFPAAVVILKVKSRVHPSRAHGFPCEHVRDPLPLVCHFSRMITSFAMRDRDRRPEDV
jgi:hypothetical protein